MAPLRDAMGLVDGETGDAEAAQPAYQTLAGQALGRDESRRSSPAFSRSQASAASLSLFIELSEAAATPRPRQLPDLVAHQGDQRRDDQCQPARDERRQLVAHRLAGNPSASPRRRPGPRVRPRSPPIVRDGNHHSRTRISGSRGRLIRRAAAWRGFARGAPRCQPRRPAARGRSAHVAG